MSHAGIAWGLTHHKDILFSPKFKMKIINSELFFKISSELRAKLRFAFNGLDAYNFWFLFDILYFRVGRA